MLFLAQFIFWIFFFIWLICSAFLVLVILNQEPKGGGVGGIFGQGSAIGDQLGLSGMQSQLHTLTRNAAIAFFLLSAILAFAGQQIFHSPVIIAAAEEEINLPNPMDPLTESILENEALSGEAEAPIEDGGEPIFPEAAEPTEETEQTE